MALSIRKFCSFAEEVHVDGRALGKAFKHVVVAAVIRNPWAGLGFVQDLAPVVAEVAPSLGEALAKRAVDLLGGAREVQAFGKAAAVGLAGEYEHANALIHTVLFGDQCRRAADGTAWMVGNQKVTPAGVILEVPMAHKHDGKDQNFYHTTPIFISDAPRDDEIVVAVGMASGPRPNARL